MYSLVFLRSSSGGGSLPVRLEGNPDLTFNFHLTFHFRWLSQRDFFVHVMNLLTLFWLFCWDVMHRDMLPLGVIHFDLILCLYCILSSHPEKGKPSAFIAENHTGPTWTCRNDTFPPVGLIVVNYLKLDIHQIAVFETVKRCMKEADWVWVYVPPLLCPLVLQFDKRWRS